MKATIFQFQATGFEVFLFTDEGKLGKRSFSLIKETNDIPILDTSYLLIGFNVLKTLHGAALSLL